MEVLWKQSVLFLVAIKGFFHPRQKEHFLRGKTSPVAISISGTLHLPVFQIYNFLGLRSLLLFLYSFLLLLFHNKVFPAGLGKMAAGIYFCSAPVQEFLFIQKSGETGSVKLWQPGAGL